MYKEIFNTENNIRLDTYLKKNINDFSRSKIQKLIQSGNITVDNYIVKPSYHLKGGENIVVDYTETRNEHNLKKENIPLDIIYEDGSIIVINKQSRLIVHPGAGNADGTLLNGLLFHFSKLSSIDISRPGIVHRLDKDTSGIIIIAKTDESHYKLAEQFASRTIKKTYRALVWGKIEDQGEIKGNINRDRGNRTLFKLLSKGKYSFTKYKLLNIYSPFSYAELYPLTGRTHQLRVHMNHIGHPILGDISYGGGIKKSASFNNQYRPIINKIFDKISRTLLHAFRIEFVHPITNKKMLFEAPIPNDFLACIKILNIEND